MQVVTYTEARNKLKSIMDKVNGDHETYIISRRNNDNVVMMSLEDYNSLMETQYLLTSPKNAERLMSSIKHARSGKVESHDMMNE